MVVVLSCVFKEPWPGDAVEFADAFARLFHTNLAFPAPTALHSLKTLQGLTIAPLPAPLQLCSDLQIYMCPCPPGSSQSDKPFTPSFSGWEAGRALMFAP